MPMVYDTEEGDNYAHAIQNAFMDMFTQDMVATLFSGAWRTEKRSRAPYKDTWIDTENGLSLYASPSLTHSCIEISGAGCERIIKLGAMELLISCIMERITRIDIACDIETDIMPEQFVATLAHERMRSTGIINSDTGQTCYIGSKQSERFARVYRYFYPHPRWNLLRVEHVFRRDYAKSVARAIMENSLMEVASASGQAFGWNHPEWQPGTGLTPDIGIVQGEKNAGKTVSWLVRSVAPAFRRLVYEGTIRDPEAFFRTYFLGEQ